MTEYTAGIREYLSQLQQVIAALDMVEMDIAVETFRKAYEEDRTIFVLGDGGSAATASHLACDLNKDACFHAAKKFRVMALNESVATLLAIGNDASFDDVFVEQLKNFARPGDVVVGISGSGNSPNILKAVEYANTLGCTTVGFCGYDGGRLKPMVHRCFHVRFHDMHIVQDVHMILVHIMARLLSVKGEHSCGG